MAVRLRLKRMGRRHRPFYRICAMDQRSPRDGKVIEELGTYDPMVPEVDARTVLKGERVDYWIGVGAQPSSKVGVLIKKYGTNGTHLDQQQAAVERIRTTKPTIPPPPAPPKQEAEPPKQEAEPPKQEAEPAEPKAAEQPAAEAAPDANADADAGAKAETKPDQPAAEGEKAAPAEGGE